MSTEGKLGGGIVLQLVNVVLTASVAIVFFAGKAQIKEIVRSEIAPFETRAESDQKWSSHQKEVEQILKRLEGQIEALNVRQTASENNYRALTELSIRVQSLEVKIDLLMAYFRKQNNISQN